VRRTGLTGASCEVQCLTGLTGGALSAQVVGGGEFNLVVTPIHPPSRRHQGPFTTKDADAGSRGSLCSGHLRLRCKGMRSRLPRWLPTIVSICYCVQGCAWCVSCRQRIPTLRRRWKERCVAPCHQRGRAA
jgi:hypothetical protein